LSFYNRTVSRESLSLSLNQPFKTIMAFICQLGISSTYKTLLFGGKEHCWLGLLM